MAGQGRIGWHISGETVIRIYGTADDSIVDGPGIRFALFVQGCRRRCPGCHNPGSQSLTGGQLVSAEALLAQVRANPLLAGVTLSGGEPFDQAAALLPFAERLRAELPHLNVWAYSGYLYEELACEAPSPAARSLLELVDVLVDGPFKDDLRSLELPWRGSDNQRLIDVPASLVAGEAVAYGHSVQNKN
ncbi:MAG: anaerobic ribonucleoside-triphosphate reductase activating protein [Actinomycetia bacterium]|nr:anaerobic ribonucleoside-triphosphate reductase activating protein [Actinomycetes bacterium]